MLKESKQLYHFINFVFAIAVSLSAFFFFKQGDRLINFGRFLGFLAPFAIIALGYILFKKFKAIEYRGKEKEREAEVKIFLTYLDKLKGDAIMFSMPLAILTIGIIVQKRLYLVDIFQAAAAFLIFYLWRRWLWHKR
ncbi:MAG: hypothetical protein ABIG10_00240 [bacterium]